MYELRLEVNRYRKDVDLYILDQPTHGARAAA